MEIPLKFYEDLSAFKLYLLDCGSLGAWPMLLPAKCWLAITFSRSLKVPLRDNYKTGWKIYHYMDCIDILEKNELNNNELSH